MKKKLLAMFLVAATTISVLAGCGSQTTGSGTDEGTAESDGTETSDDTAASNTGEDSQKEESGAAETVEAAEFAGYPVDTDEVLTLWTNQIMPSSTAASWEESLDNYDAFIQTLNDMGAERMLEIRQAAYDRFLAR